MSSVLSIHKNTLENVRGVTINIWSLTLAVEQLTENSRNILGGEAESLVENSRNISGEIPTFLIFIADQLCEH